MVWSFFTLQHLMLTCISITKSRRTVITYFLTRQARYYNVNTEARSCNHCCSGRTINMYVCSIIYPACNAHAPYCHLWPVRQYHIFPHYLKNGTNIEKKVTKHKMCFDFIYKFVLNISLSKKKSAWHIGLYVKYPLFWLDFSKTLIKYPYIRKYSNVKLHENPSSGARTVPFGRADERTDRQTIRRR
jgi:hypothetical protein